MLPPQSSGAHVPQVSEKTICWINTGAKTGDLFLFLSCILSLSPSLFNLSYLAC